MTKRPLICNTMKQLKKLPLEFKANWSFRSDDKRRNMLGNVQKRIKTGRLEKPETGIRNRNRNRKRQRDRNSNVKGNRYKNRDIIYFKLLLILIQFIQKLRKLVLYHAPPLPQNLFILRQRENRKSRKQQL